MSEETLNIRELRSMNVYEKHNAGNKPYAKADLMKLYEKSYDELALQQSKRDQTIALYVTVVTALIAYVIPTKEADLPMDAKGIILVAAAAIGILLSIIIIRYRIYKEAYWLCCQALTVLMNIPEEERTEDKIKAIYAQVMHTKYKKLFEPPKKEKEHFHFWRFVGKNLMSAETVYFAIEALCAGGLMGLGLGYILWEESSALALWIGIPVGIIVALALIFWYFVELAKIPRGLTNAERFGAVFKNAWFLHLFVTPEKEKSTNEPNAEIVNK